MSAHSKVLIVDFGSQVTQLIARRVRESGVYCEIHPFDRVADILETYDPGGGDPCQAARPPAGTARQSGGAAFRVRARRAGAGYLLRRNDPGRPARRQGGGRTRARVRPRGDPDRTDEPVDGWPGRRRRSRRDGVDEPRRQDHRHPAGLRGGGHLARLAVRGHRRRGAGLLWRAVPSRSGAHPARRGHFAQFHPPDRGPFRRLDHGRLPGRGGGPHPRPSGEGARAAGPVRRRGIPRWRRC